jgi:hypothetical protein
MKNVLLLTKSNFSWQLTFFPPFFNFGIILLCKSSNTIQTSNTWSNWPLWLSLQLHNIINDPEDVELLHITKGRFAHTYYWQYGSRLFCLHSTKQNRIFKWASLELYFSYLIWALLLLLWFVEVFLSDLPELLV